MLALFNCKTVTIAQQVQDYSDDGSYFGVDAADRNTISWDQLAFGDWASNCYNGTTLCTFNVSADPTLYYLGVQFYPNYPIAQSDVTPTGYGPYQSYDGISLNGSRGQSMARKPLGAFTEPLPPMPCTADANGNCAIVQSSAPYTLCDTGQTGIHGQPVFVKGSKATYSIYRNGSPVHYLETAVRTTTVPPAAPCTFTTRWSPGEPRVQYNDANLP